MSSVPRQACLCGKRQYSKKHLAREAAKRLAALKEEPKGFEVQAYKCPFNHRIWHIGHANGRKTGYMSRESKRIDLERIIRQEAREAS